VAYDIRVVKNISIYGDMHRYIPVIAKWAGFSKITEKVVEHRERKFGTSKYGWTRLISGFLDLLTLMFVGKFSKKPMHFFGSMGIVSFTLGFVFTMSILWQKIDSIYISKIPLKREVYQQPMFYLALVALVIGVQLFMTGFIADLMARQSLSKKDYLVIDRLGIDPVE
jgi:hypothetical protein